MSDAENKSENQSKGNAWTPSQSMAVAGNEDGVDLRVLTAALWGGKWIIAAIAAVVLVLALLYAFLAHPVYEADALIQIEQQNQTPGTSTDILSLLLPMAAPADAEIAIMTSRSVLQPAVEHEHLNIVIAGEGLPFIGHSDVTGVAVTQLQVPGDWMDQKLELTPKGNGAYELASPSGDEVLKGQVGRLVSARNGTVKILVSRLDAPAGESITLTRLYDQEAISTLQKNLTAAEQGKDTGIVQITLDGPQPTRTRDILNTLVDQYINQNVAVMALQAKTSLAFINKQLPQLKKQLDAAEAKLTVFKTKNGAVGLDQQAQTMLQVLTTLESQLTQLNLAEAAMRQSYTSRYPGFRALRGQEKDIQRKVEAIETKINLLPKQEQNYLGLMQDVQVYTQLYTTLLAKVQDLQLAEAGTVGSARVVDYAVTPIKPVAPRKSIIVVLGLLLGLFLGVMVVFLRHALSRTVQDAAALEREFGLPVYAVVPHSDQQDYLIKKAKRSHATGIPLLAVDDPLDPTVESIRSLRTSINFALQGSARKVITLGGCAPGVGKSFLSVNLAHVLGASGARILLVDADMRRGHLEKYMDGRKQPGLSQILSGEVSSEEAIRHSPYSKNVDFLPTGIFPPNPYELLTNPRLRALIDTCSDSYDLVVVDVPPVLAVAEGLLINRLATANFLVVRAGSQTLQELRLAVDRMRQNGIQPNGFVFNDLTRQAATNTYGRYAKTYYYTRYGNQGKK